MCKNKFFLHYLENVVPPFNETVKCHNYIWGKGGGVLKVKENANGTRNYNSLILLIRYKFWSSDVLIKM